MELLGSKALVTGGALRIGRSICELLAECGCSVVVHYNASENDALSFCEQLNKQGASAFSVRGDLSVPVERDRIVEEAAEKAGGLDFLVNNASVFYKDPMDVASKDRILNTVKVNYLAPMALTEAFTRIARNESDQGALNGKIVNLLDRRIVGDDPECVQYQLSKKMLADYTTCMAVKLAPSFTVNGVAPGPILAPPGKGDDYVRDMAGHVPMGNGGTPRDVSNAVVFLLESDAITGQIVFVDGGQHLEG